MTGDSVAALVGLDLQIGSLLDTTLGRPISSTDLSRLNLYRSADASFDSSDVSIGVDSVLVVDGISTLRPFNVEVLPRGETFYIATAQIDSLAVGGAFSLGFPAGGFKVRVTVSAPLWLRLIPTALRSPLSLKLLEPLVY